MRGFTLCLAVLLAGAGCGAPGGDRAQPPAPEPAPAPTPEPRLLVLGDVERGDPTLITTGMQPMADLLAGRLAAHGISGGAVRVAPDPQTMGRWMADGEVDLYFDTSYPASVVREIADARPLLRRWKRGAAEYHSIVFSRADSDLTTVAELGGLLVAFDDPASTSGYLLPMELLLAAGLHPVPVTTADTMVDSPEVACLFTGDDANVIEWVLAERAAAGSVDSLTWEGDIPAETRNRLRILATSESHPRGFLMVRSDLEPAVVAEIRAVLLGLHESAQGRAVLDAMITSRFDEFPTDPNATLDRIVELRRRVEPRRE